jgi:hypothetical protein
MLSDATQDFFILAADANRDRHVDLTDFTILASNFNKTGKAFSQGNFDYDASGSVDLTDFTILAARFNKSLAAPATASAVGADREDALLPAAESISRVWNDLNLPPD